MVPLQPSELFPIRRESRIGVEIAATRENDRLLSRRFQEAKIILILLFPGELLFVDENKRLPVRRYHQRSVFPKRAVSILLRGQRNSNLLPFFIRIDPLVLVIDEIDRSL